jgi:MOSC domain-containing protein YiiM
MPRLISVQVGLPRVLDSGPDDSSGSSWESGIFKERVAGPVWLGRLNLAGDGQADMRNHGGPDRAVLAYSADHYPLWREELDRRDLAHGVFGENLTIAGLTEDTVCIGDSFALGDAVLQVSQPRQPCWKLERRLGQPGLVEMVLATGRGGWYCRVLREGYVEAGTSMVRLERPFPEWTITRAHDAMRRRGEDPESAARLALCTALSAGWREVLQGI